MGPEDLQASLADRLRSVDDSAVEGIVRAILARGQGAMVLSLLDELEDRSSKALSAALEALPDLSRRDLLESLEPWLDLGIAIGETSGAAALKYFRESPLLLGLIGGPAERAAVLRQAIELAEGDANIALEFLRQAPALMTTLSSEQVGRWCEIGAELADCDYVLGMEFFKQAHAIASIVPADRLRDWIGFAMKLVTQNSLGKTDYVGTLEFFRTSPAILAEVGQSLRPLVIDVGSVLADRSPEAAIRCLADCPSILARLPSESWAAKVLSFGVFIAQRDPESCLNYLVRCPDVFGGAGAREDAAAVFDQWYRGGMEILELSVDGGRAYFALETRKAVSALEESASSVSLRQVARTLKLFAQGLCGSTVAIEPLPDEVEKGQPLQRPTVVSDGRTIAVPARISRYPGQDANRRLYLAMVAHEAGHLEYGTYELTLRRVPDLLADVQRRYGHGGDVPSLEDLFLAYPQPLLIRDLWTVLEDARVEHRLQVEYPGLAADLAALAREAVTTRSLNHGMTVKELVVDCLLLTTLDPSTVRIPDAIEPIMSRAWDLARPVLRVEATAEGALRAAHGIYVLLDEMVAAPSPAEGGSGDPPPPAADTSTPAASEEAGGAYRPMANWAYRGAMNPALIHQEADATDEPTTAPAQEAPEAEDTQASASLSPPRPDSVGAERVSREQPASQALSASATSGGTGTAAVRARRPTSEGADGVFYDEWDGGIQDYRTRWCRVIERTVTGADWDFVDGTLERHGPAVAALRRYFESLRPAALRKMYGQMDGDDLDLDATIRRVLDRAAGAEGSDRVYVRRERRERNVAVAFLMDLSGSTSRQIEPDGRRVVDVEKEALVLLTHALDAIGDQYALYGYSSHGRQAVDFLVVKDFDDAALHASPRIGALSPLQQNRDGAAIRHAVHKLLMRQARSRLLVLLSDGKPLDVGYTEEYALEDTKRALAEARQAGIHPFCITVDHGADDYLRRMYGDVHYLVIDRVATLPERLPRLYQRLTA